MYKVDENLLRVAMNKAKELANADFKSTFVYFNPSQGSSVWQTSSKVHIPGTSLFYIEIEPNFTGE